MKELYHESLGILNILIIDRMSSKGIISFILSLLYISFIYLAGSLDPDLSTMNGYIVTYGTAMVVISAAMQVMSLIGMLFSPISFVEIFGKRTRMDTIADQVTDVITLVILAAYFGVFLTLTFAVYQAIVYRTRTLNDHYIVENFPTTIEEYEKKYEQ